MEWELTNEEIAQATERDYQSFVDGRPIWYKDNCGKVAQAQAKKLVEWGDELCEIVGHGGYGSKPKQRSQCPYCWQELKRQVGL